MNSYTYDAAMFFLAQLKREVDRMGFENWKDREFNPSRFRIREERVKAKNGAHFDRFLQFQKKRKEAA
jgi:hypothetical protein